MYCDFYSVDNREDLINEYINSLILEIKHSNINTTNWVIKTMFIGGGTPSLIKSKYIELILITLNKKHNLSHLKEITIEVNPGEASKRRLRNYLGLGINRLSIGVQSLNPYVLKFLTRTHEPDEVFKTFYDARSVGFKNINCDLIYSIPNQSWITWEKDLRKIINLKPEHISTYTLTSEKGTQLFKSIKEKEITMPLINEKVKWFLSTHRILTNENFIPYEISNFSKKEVSVLASSDNCSIQALSYLNHAFSVQFHPEVVDETIQNWISIPKIKRDFYGALGAEGIAETLKYQQSNRRSLINGAKLIYENWLKLIEKN